MKRINGTPTRLLRVKLLPGCLALALVVGSNVLSPEYANAQASLANASRSNEPFVAAAHTAGLPGPERQALIERMQSAARTPPPVPAASIVVSNCLDSGPGSYRQAVLDAVSGDTIDLTSTGCSLITLTTGDVLTFLNDLTLQGPGALTLTIDGGSSYRPLQHLGTGTLTINDLTIADGKKYVADGGLGNASGGCVHSQGVVSVNHASVKYCDAGSSSTTIGVKGGAIYGKAGVYLANSLVTGSTAHSEGSFVKGGAIYGKAVVYLNNSLVTGSTAHSSSSFAYGGGVYSAGNLYVVNSYISGNTAHSTASWGQGGGAAVGNFYTAGGNTFIEYSTVQNNVAFGGTDGRGGGLYTTGNVYIWNSTIAGNQAAFAGGLELEKGATVTAPFSINSSTISGNNSTGYIGGVYVSQNPTQIKNSTIAFNLSLIHI